MVARGLPPVLVTPVVAERQLGRKMGPVAAALPGLSAGQSAMGVFSLLDQRLSPTKWIPPNGQGGGVKMVLKYAVMTGLLCRTVIVWLVTRPSLTRPSGPSPRCGSASGGRPAS